MALLALVTRQANFSHRFFLQLATAYHAERVHYDHIGECLIRTLKAGLGEAWTDEAANAWGWIYAITSKTMADAGEKAHFDQRKFLV